MSDLTCTVCGSDRILSGPAYAKHVTTCLDCGDTQGSAIPEPTPIAPPPAIPVGGFKSADEIKQHLAKMQQQGKTLLQEKTSRKGSSKDAVKTNSDSETIPADLVMLVIHRYSRREESWVAVLSSAKEEKQYRNDNVRVFAHKHQYGAECSGCKEI